MERGLRRKNSEPRKQNHCQETVSCASPSPPNEKTGSDTTTTKIETKYVTTTPPPHGFKRKKTKMKTRRKTPPAPI
jgi:hypothetical protein